MRMARYLIEGDIVSRTVAASLLILSVASWVVIAWKAWLLQRAQADVARGTAAYWQSDAQADAPAAVAAFDRHALLAPFVTALHDAAVLAPGAAIAGLAQRRTRLLRGALHSVLGRLQFGQVLLASIGAIAPFIGLLGTVWGIRHALTAIAGAGQITIERIAGPVGEALVMTAAGLAVAIPAVFAYNLFGRRIGRIEAELEGFAQDLRDL